MKETEKVSLGFRKRTSWTGSHGTSVGWGGGGVGQEGEPRKTSIKKTEGKRGEEERETSNSN